MSNVELGDVSPSEIPVTELSHVQTAGCLIRAAREAAGVQIDALAMAMKVPVRKLEALEADRPDILLDVVFVRALASSVCRTLKVDSAPIMALLPPTAKPSFEPHSRGINAPFKVPGELRNVGLFGYFKLPALIIALLLFVAAALVFFAPEMNVQEIVSEKSNIASSPALSDVEDAVVQTQDKPLPTADVVPSNSREVLEIPKHDIVETVLPEKAPLVLSSELISVKARESSWVEIVDVNGTVLVRKLLQPQEMVTAGGDSTLSVVIGRADVVDVRVRGKLFNMTNISKDNVARFEVK